MRRRAFARLTILDKGESMQEYHKIQTVFKRDMENKGKTLLEGQWTLPEFEFLANNEWTFTEKVDGTNIRIMYDGQKVSFGGKTDRAAIPAKLVDRLRDRFPGDFCLAGVFDHGDVCLYGEGYGAGIQNGGNYRPDQDFVLFDVKIGPWWLQRKDVEDIAAKLDLPVVPIVGTGTLLEAVEFVRHGMVSHWNIPCAEGIVARPRTELMTRGGDRIITKIKCRDFS